MTDSGRTWPWILLGLSIAYLVIEFAFNATLLQTASSLDIDPDSLYRTELFGRSVSGAGFTLLLLGILVRWEFSLNTPLRRSFTIFLILTCLAPFALDFSAGYVIMAAIAAVGGAILLLSTRATPKRGWAILGLILFAWTAMFAGQKILIEHFLINPSSWEERQTAQYMQLLKAGLARNLVHIEEAPLDPERLDAPEERTFIALVGALVIHTPEFLQIIKDQEEELIRRVAAAVKQDELPIRYATYKIEGERFQDLWSQYRNKSREYILQKDRADITAREEFAKLLNRLSVGWGDYQKGVERFSRSMKPRAEKLSPELTDYFKRRGECRVQSCVDRLDRDYSQKIKRFLGKDVPWTFWCDERSASVNEAIDDGLNRIISAPFAAIGRVLGQSGLGYQAPERYRCNTNVSQVQVRLMVLHESDFQRQSNGYPLGIMSESEFIAHQNTAANVRKEMARRGINLPATWGTSDVPTFVTVTAKHIRAEADNTWKNGIRELIGGDIPPGLGYSSLVNHPRIQSHIAQAMGDSYIKGMSFEYSEREFKRHVIDHHTDRLISTYISKIRHQAREFANGGAREEEGKQYLRAVLIPPISLALSLFFVLLTSAKSIVMLIEKTGVLLHIRLTPIRRHALIAGGWVIVISMLIFIPMQLPNKFADARAFNYFADNARANSPLMTAMMEWTIRMQPIVYPVGEPIATSIEKALDNAKHLLSINQTTTHPQIPRLLVKAESALAADRLMTPESDAAFTYYSAVLLLDSSNRKARSGLKKIIRRYQVLARNAEDNNNARLAATYHERAKVVGASLQKTK